MSESSNDVDPNPFVLDVTINPDIKCPIENVVKKTKKKTAYLHTHSRSGGVPSFGLWTTQPNLQFVSPVLVVRRETWLKLTQLTVSYKLYVKFDRQTLWCFFSWRYIFTSFASCRRGGRPCVGVNKQWPNCFWGLIDPQQWKWFWCVLSEADPCTVL